MALFIGIDIGTQTVKVCISTEDGKTVAVKSRTYEFLTPHPNWAEQDAEEWWIAASEAIAACVSELKGKGVSPAEIRGIGFSGQMHGLVPIDKYGRVLRRAIIHCDQRSAGAIEKMYELVPAEEMCPVTFNRLSPGFLLASLFWMRENEPELYERIDTALLPKDYVRYRLTGEIGTEYSDASGSCALDITKREWAYPLIERLKMDPTVFPRVYASEAVCGAVTKAAAAAS